VNNLPNIQPSSFQEYFKDQIINEHLFHSPGLKDELLQDISKISIQTPDYSEIFKEFKSEIFKEFKLDQFVIKKKVCPFLSFMNKVEKAVQRNFQKVKKFFINSYNSLTGKKVTVKKKGKEEPSVLKDLEKRIPIDGGGAAEDIDTFDNDIKNPIIKKKITCPYLAVVKFSKRVWSAVKDVFQKASDFCKDSYHSVVGKKKKVQKGQQKSERPERPERRTEEKLYRQRGRIDRSSTRNEDPCGKNHGPL